MQGNNAFGPLRWLPASLLALVLAGTAYAQDKVDINKADAAEIDRVLLNIGPSKAEAIVAWREENGPFKSADELAQVKGVGLKTVEKNADRIEISGGGAATAPAKTTAAAKAAAPKPAAPKVTAQAGKR